MSMGFLTSDTSAYVFLYAWSPRGLRAYTCVRAKGIYSIMRCFVFLMLFLPMSLLCQDRFFLFLENKSSKGFVLNNSLNNTNQIFLLEKGVDTLKFYNEGLSLIYYKDSVDIYFGKTFEGKYKAIIWKDPHYYIFKFTLTNSFYYFYEIFPFMEKP